jgi:hypothetical protein
MILRKNFENALKLLFVLLLCLSLTVGYAQDQDEATPVTITEVASTNVAPSVPAAGTVFSRNETQVTAGMAGRVEWLAEPGDYLCRIRQPGCSFRLRDARVATGTSAR